ncbi:MAG: glycoside hydrolase family 44 protein [Deltaproteobacteria bacterium]|nr:glycoside hydrolase family 44 protein [Deltaproteobacteria bacterium]
MKKALRIGGLVALASLPLGCGGLEESPTGSVDTSQSPLVSITGPTNVYVDSLSSSFANWSTARVTMVYQALSHGGSKASIRLEPDLRKSLILHSRNGIDATTVGSIELYIHGGTGSGNQRLDAGVKVNGVLRAVPLETYVSGGSIASGVWRSVVIPFSVFGVTSGTLTDLQFQDRSNSDQPALYLDGIRILPPAAVLPPPPPPPTQPGLVLFDDQLAPGVENWSWATLNLTQLSPTHAGSASMMVQLDGWSGLYLHFGMPLSRSTYDRFEVFVRSAGTSQAATVYLTEGGAFVGGSSLASFVAGGTIPSTGWALATIPFSALGGTGAIDGLIIQDASGADQPALYLDDLKVAGVTAPPNPASGITVSVNTSADRHPIDVGVLGVNFGTSGQMSTLHWPVRRWGGNHTSRYNYLKDATNRASDWFFLNAPESNGNAANLPSDSTANRFIDETRAAGGQVLLTVPTIGWVTKDRVRAPAYPISVYGPQRSNECAASGYASWCDPDAGDGVRPDGSNISGDPNRTSIQAPPSFVRGWVDHLVSRLGPASTTGQRYYALDNEVTLWNTTHRDVHPGAVTFDEIWQNALAYASAIKAADPGAKTFGPAAWGWCAYFGGSNECGGGPDQAAHGGLPLLAWYLQQTCSTAASTGLRVIDYLDVHFYPQGPGVFGSSEDSATAAMRLRSLKSLYDPNYVDESWIGQPIELIPRMRRWIDSYCPGTKLAITEYSFGTNDNSVTNALAQAEALAIFGREGVDIATRWEAPAPNTLVEDAFRMFLSFDGSGGRVSGHSVRATSSDDESIGSYAIDGGSRVFVFLFNRSTAAKDTRVDLSGSMSSGALYRFDASNRYGAAGSLPGTPGGFNLALPSRSASLVVVNR